MTKKSEQTKANTVIQHINPDSLPMNPAFTWVVTVAEFLVEMDAIAIVPYAS